MTDLSKLPLTLLVFLLSVFVTSAEAGQTPFALDQPGNGCGKDLPPNIVLGGPSTTFNLARLDTSRQYLLHVPKGYKTNVKHALYFSFHGASKDMFEQEILTRFSDPQFNQHGIVVYPQGINGKWLSNPKVSFDFPNDLDFINELLDELNEMLCIDTDAVYAAGKSNGGGLTNLIACNSTVGSRFAAFASVSGAYYDVSEHTGPCDSPGKTYTPFLELHGLQDCIAPYNGGPGQGETIPKLPVSDILTQWLVNNQCDKDQFDDPTIIPAPKEYLDYVEIQSWSCEDKTGIVQHYQEDGLNHIWPSLYTPNDDCNHMETCRPIPNYPSPKCPAGSKCYSCPIGSAPDRHYVYNGTTVIFDFFSKYKLPDRG